MITFFRRLILALQFLTIITVRSKLEAKNRDLAGSTPFFPVIGLILGAALVLSRIGLDHAFPPFLTDALVIGLWIILTRGLHLEGVADCADGLIGGYTKERSLEIMKDSNSGAFAIMGVAFIILIKFAALTSIAPGMKITALLIVPVIGRLVMVLLMYLSKSARENSSLGKLFVDEIKGVEASAAIFIALIITILLSGKIGAFIICGGILYTFLLQYYFSKRLGGITGDVIGASCETSELLCLLALASYGV